MKKLVTLQSFLVLIAIGVVVTAVIVNVPASDRTLLNLVSIIVSGLTLLGLVVTIKQVIDVGTIAENTKAEVSKKINSFNQTLFYSEISKIDLLINEIKKYLREKNFEISISKLDNVKTLLIQISEEESSMTENVSRREVRKHLTNLQIDTDNLEKFLNNPTNIVDVPAIINNIENVKTFLIKIRTNINLIDNGY